MVLGAQRFLCSIPRVEKTKSEEEEHVSPAEQEKELARATDRGLELLREMEGRCMYFIAGWWSYSFCYLNQVRQFHALPPGNGVPFYPPAEDPTAHAYVLGRFRGGNNHNNKGSGGLSKPSGSRKPSTDVAELQTKGDSRYLVQYLEDGTTCDLTGRNRKIEVQFHCHPQTTDRIGWIKEVTTCSYLMIIYTPRLCNDVAFQPPRDEEAHAIACREILRPDEIRDWESAIAAQREADLLYSQTEHIPIIGDIEIGAMKYVGKDGKRIEKGKVASAGDENVEIVAKSEGGHIHRLSKEDLKKYQLDPERIDGLKKQLEELANGKDWKLEVTDANGERGLRGVIDSDVDEDEDEDDGYGAKGDTNKKSENRDNEKTAAKKGDQKPNGKGKDDQNSKEGSEEKFFKEEL